MIDIDMLRTSRSGIFCRLQDTWLIVFLTGPTGRADFVAFEMLVSASETA